MLNGLYPITELPSLPELEVLALDGSTLDNSTLTFTSLVYLYPKVKSLSLTNTTIHIQNPLNNLSEKTSFEMVEYLSLTNCALLKSSSEDMLNRLLKILAYFPQLKSLCLRSTEVSSSLGTCTDSAFTLSHEELQYFIIAQYPNLFYFNRSFVRPHFYIYIQSF